MKEGGCADGGGALVACGWGGGRDTLDHHPQVAPTYRRGRGVKPMEMWRGGKRSWFLLGGWGEEGERRNPKGRKSRYLPT